MDVCTLMVVSLCCSPETIATLLTSYTSIQNEKFFFFKFKKGKGKKRKRERKHSHQEEELRIVHAKRGAKMAVVKETWVLLAEPLNTIWAQVPHQ